MENRINRKKARCDAVCLGPMDTGGKKKNRDREEPKKERCRGKGVRGQQDHNLGGGRGQGFLKNPERVTKKGGVSPFAAKKLTGDLDKRGGATGKNSGTKAAKKSNGGMGRTWAFQNARDACGKRWWGARSQKLETNAEKGGETERTSRPKKASAK